MWLVAIVLDNAGIKREKDKEYVQKLEGQQKGCVSPSCTKESKNKGKNTERERVREGGGRDKEREKERSCMEEEERKNREGNIK